MPVETQITPITNDPPLPFLETAAPAASVPEYTINGAFEAVPAETSELIVQPITVDDLNAAANDICTAVLAGAFLIAGILAGLGLLRGFYHGN